MKSHLELNTVSCAYGENLILKNIDLSLDKGEIGCLLGESGSGKTTLLRAVAGFEDISAGFIALNGDQLSNKNKTLAPEKRRMGMIFQDFALFPHLNVMQNIEFGIQVKERDARELLSRKMISLVGLPGLEKAMPHQLSGGQQQRVAIARALVVEPDLLLLDEPFSNVDTRLKNQLVREIRSLLLENNITAILVTHDQHEAFSFADKLFLIHQGCCVESGSPSDLYKKPKTRFAAQLLGEGRIVDLTQDITGIPVMNRKDSYTGEKKLLLIRPEHVTFSRGSGLKFPVISRQFKGDHTLVEIQLRDGQSVLCRVDTNEDVEVGKSIEVSFNLQHSARINA